jgi:SAM-dependent methyltransferase
MFEAEAAWLENLLKERTPEELSPLLNIGSSTRYFRETEQPWTERRLFAPLRALGVKVIHLDSRDGDGIDIRADVLSDADLPRIRALAVKSVLCCNILEHVRDPKALAARCIDIVGPGGLIFVTVPFSYPHHRDPIDTMFRPSPEALALLFRPAIMARGEILDVGESYRGHVKRRPWILLRHVFRFPFPFIRFRGWKRSMRKLYWLLHNYRITGALFRVPPAAEGLRQTAFVDSACRTP